MLLDLCRTLPTFGVIPSVAAAVGGELEAAFRATGVSVAVAPSIGGSYRRLALSGWISEHMRRTRAEVLHTHLGMDVWGGIAALRDRRYPWISTIHSHMPEDGVIRSYLRGRCYRRAHRVLAISEELRTLAIKRYGLTEAQTGVVRLGIDLSRFIASRPQGRRDIPRCAVIGRLVPSKNFATVFRACAQVKRPWTLTVIGEGPEEDRLRALAQTLGILPRVRFVGAVPDIAPLLPDVDLLLFPSREEGQGLVLLEGMASGVPTIASDLPVLHETFTEDSTTFVAPDDVAGWSAAIAQSLDDPARAIEKAKRAQRIVRERFSLGTMAQAYARVYGEVCESST